MKKIIFALIFIGLHGSTVPENANVKVYTVSAALNDACSLENPDKIKSLIDTMPYARDLTIELEPYTVVVVEIMAE